MTGHAANLQQAVNNQREIHKYVNKPVVVLQTKRLSQATCNHANISVGVEAYAYLTFKNKENTNMGDYPGPCQDKTPIDNVRDQDKWGLSS